MKVRWLLLILLIPSGFPRAAAAERDPASEIDDFLKSYREARARLLSQYESCRAAGVMTDTLTDRGASSPRRLVVQEYEYAVTGANERLATKQGKATLGGEDQSSSYPEGIILRRGTQLYALKGSTEGGDYSLVFRGGDLSAGVRDLDKNRGRFFRPTCDAPGFNLPVFLDKPELSIQSVKPETRNGEALVRVDYTVTLKVPKAPIQRAWCLLKPDSDWSLREFETVYEGGTTPYSYSGVVNYAPGSDPVPKFKSVQQKLTLPGSVQVTDFTYDRFDFADSPASEFSLARYGLGEVEAPPSRPTNRLPLWFGGIAAITLILSVWLRVVAKRRGRASAA